MNTSAPVAASDNMARSTMILVLMAEAAFFGTLLMAYLYLRTADTTVGLTRISLTDQLFAAVNTAILLVSAGTITLARLAIERGDIGSLRTKLSLTLGLGVVFVTGQILEFVHSGMFVNDASMGGIFFALIAFHALHVLGGMVIHVINAIRTQAGDFTAQHHTSVLVGTWFWYFVTAVWCILFVALYLV